MQSIHAWLTARWMFCDQQDARELLDRLIHVFQHFHFAIEWSRRQSDITYLSRVDKLYKWQNGICPSKHCTGRVKLRPACPASNDANKKQWSRARVLAVLTGAFSTITKLLRISLIELNKRNVLIYLCNSKHWLSLLFYTCLCTSPKDC